MEIPVTQNAELIEKTWAEIGRKIRPLRNIVFMRTELLPEMDGHIYLPPSVRGNYSGLPHKVFMRAVVIAVGPKCKLKVGQRIAFSRLFFARWEHMEDKTLVGYVQEENIQAEVVEDVVENVAAAE
jgi:hypothetical protein